MPHVTDPTPPTMKAITFHRYGPPDVLDLRDVEVPAIEDDKVLIRVRAASVNPLDWHYMRGKPYAVRARAGLRRPKDTGLGADLAGVVEAVGENVTDVRPGEEVYGMSNRTLAEYTRVSPTGIAPKPSNLTFEQAAAVPVAATTALQGLRDRGGLQAGMSVLINGAAGGVGTFAVQIAKSFGAEVTGVCGTRNSELVRSLGADHVVDYTQDDFTRSGTRYDLILSLVDSHSLTGYRRALTAKGVAVLGGAPKGQWVAPLTGPLKALVVSRFVGQRLVPFLSKRSRDDLLELKDLIESGAVTPVIDRTHTLAETPEAIRYLEEGHARGKVVVTV